MIKKLVKSIKIRMKLKRYNENVKKDLQNLKIIFRPEDINNEGYIFDYSPASLVKHNIVLAGMEFIAFTNNMGGRHLVPRIMYDDLFEDLSEETQQFIIQHEMGHFKLHQDIILNATGGLRDFKMEVEADKYAAEQIGYEAAIRAMREMYELLLEMNLGVEYEGTMEILNRIECL